MGTNTSDTLLSKVPVRLVLTLALLLLFGWLTLTAGRAGIAGWLTHFAALSHQLVPAGKAVQLEAGYAEAHHVHAVILETKNLNGAVSAYHQAALARPEDYVLWLSLARAHELNGDTAEAIAAARQALPLAPYYAEPHYQLGNILLRAGQTEAAFKELRLAGKSNPNLMPGIIDLAWQISSGNVVFVEQVIAPDSPQTFRALGSYFRRRNAIDAALAMYRAAGRAAMNDRRSFVTELIAVGRFKEAASLWGMDRSSVVREGELIDPGFDHQVGRDAGFGWIRSEEKSLRFKLDENQPRDGRSSLNVQFDGDSNPSLPVISQLVLVEPGTRYELRFAARAENLVSGSMPLIVVVEARSKNVMASSEHFGAATRGWRDYAIDFVTYQTAEAVEVSLLRQTCSAPCPIFGRLWLDNFSLVKL